MAADDQPVDLDTDLVRQLARALSGLHRDVRDLSPLPRSAKYGTDSPDNTSILDEYADAIWSEIIAARGGESSIDARLDGYAALITSHNNEILAARGGEASIDARLDGYASLLTSLNSEVTAARSGAASLDARIDAVAATAAAAATSAQIANLQNQINDGKASVNALRNDLVNLRQWLADRLGASPPGGTANPW